ncbi:MAG: hypothetical protein AAFR51_03990 [Pseudomonadota bacterium]
MGLGIIDELNLPTDPEDAFVVYEKYLREEFLVPAEHETESNHFEREYVLHVAAFCSVYKIDLGVDLERLTTLDGSEFWDHFNALKTKVRFHALTLSLSAHKRSSEGNSAIYVLNPAQKTRIHKQLHTIREILADAELSEKKRDALANRLNAFAAEVDRDRTRGEALLAAYVWTKKEIKDATDLTDRINGIFDILSKAKEYLPSLPAPKVPKQLPAPEPRQDLGKDFSQDFDDEIPF